MSTSADDENGRLREELLARVREQAWIDEPETGFTGVEQFLAGSPVAPGPQWTRIEDRGRITTERRDVWLYTYHRAHGEPLEVPVGFVWDKTNEDLRLRVYYNKAHFGSEEPRRPLVAPEEAPVPAEMAAYVDAMRSGDGERIRAVVDPDATFNSPFGPVSGADFIQAFSQTPPVGARGVPLQIATVTSDGHRHAVEFISWRRPPHGGLGVYTFAHGRVVALDVFEGPVRR